MKGKCDKGNEMQTRKGKVYREREKERGEGKRREENVNRQNGN